MQTLIAALLALSANAADAPIAPWILELRTVPVTDGRHSSRFIQIRTETQGPEKWSCSTDTTRWVPLDKDPLTGLPELKSPESRACPNAKLRVTDLRKGKREVYEGCSDDAVLKAWSQQLNAACRPLGG